MVTARICGRPRFPRPAHRGLKPLVRGRPRPLLPGYPWAHASRGLWSPQEAPCGVGTYSDDRVRSREAVASGNGGLVALAKQIGDLTQELVRKVEERDQALRRLLG
jgi:hypothetical protein